MDKSQIRAIFLFQFKLGRKAAQTARDINIAFGDNTTTERTAQFWFQRFKRGEESLEDDDRSGPPSEFDNDVLKSMVKADPQITTRELAEILEVSPDTISLHLKQIGMVKKLDKWVPHELNELFHDNARPHVSKITVQKLHELGYETLTHPPYSPDLAPTDYHFFKHLDHFVRQKQFNKQEAIENDFIEFIDSRNPDFYKNGINLLLSRWQKCADSNGAYFD